MPVVFAGWPGQVKVRVFEGSNVHVGDVLVPSGHGNGTAKVNQSSAVFKDELGFAVGCHGNMPPQVLMLMGTPVCGIAYVFTYGIFLPGMKLFLGDHGVWYGWEEPPHFPKQPDL